MLRPVADTDVELMREWRNQPANRAVSIAQHEIGPDEHLAWWSRVKDDPTRRVLVFTQSERALGIVTFFDVDLTGAGPRSGSWGFFLDNETVTVEGIAMMAWIAVMKDATAYAFDELGLDVLHAEVHEDNAAVRQMNRRFGFTEGEPETKDDGRVFFPISLRREDRRPQRTRGQQ